MIITAEKFTQVTGHAPVQDDLERSNCNAHGIGHEFCGWCGAHDQPRFCCVQCHENRRASFASQREAK